MALQINRENLAWVAGVFDGEGWASAARRNHKTKGMTATLMLGVGQAHPEMLERVRAAVGLGTINGPTKRGMWNWKVHGFEKVQAVYAMLWPWLGSVKRHQIEVVLTEAKTHPTHRRRRFSDQQVVEAPETLTFAEVRDEPNTEVRRHLLDRFGGLRGSAAAGAWLKAGNLKPISEVDITAKMQPSGLSIWKLSNGDAPVLCKLYRAELPDDEPLILLFVVCTSTAKEVFLRVPPTMKDAAKARDWTFGESLAEAVET